jgi:hypothetical protein
VTIIAAIGAGLVALLGLVFKLWRGAANARDAARAEAKAQTAAREDDADRFEVVVDHKAAAELAAAKDVPTAIAGVRDEVGKLGGAPWPPAPKGKP